MEQTICVGLQGGGSHGAYTWGVLDCLLDEQDISIEALSGASAGALNAAIFASGYLSGGRTGAQRALAAFWQTIVDQRAAIWPGAGTPADTVTNTYVSLTRYFSPYQLNPFNINPLRAIVCDQIDFEALRSASPVRLFISATRVRDGALRIFTEDVLTAEVLLASSCLPSLHHAVHIDGEAYWDGALTANPPVSPLVYRCEASEVLIIGLMPGHKAEVPNTAEAIVDRVREISFSSALSTELQSIADAQASARRTVSEVGPVDLRLRALQLSVLDPTQDLGELDADTRMKIDATFIARLHARGYAAAEKWLRSRSARPATVGLTPVRQTNPAGTAVRSSGEHLTSLR